MQATVLSKTGDQDKHENKNRSKDCKGYTFNVRTCRGAKSAYAVIKEDELNWNACAQFLIFCEKDFAMLA